MFATVRTTGTNVGATLLDLFAIHLSGELRDYLDNDLDDNFDDNVDDNFDDD